MTASVFCVFFIGKIGPISGLAFDALYFLASIKSFFFRSLPKIRINGFI